jgi:hypothetical protein
MSSSELLEFEQAIENRLPKVGVTSGVGRPAALMMTPVEERLYEMLLLRSIFFSSASPLGGELSARERFRTGRLDEGVGERITELLRNCLIESVLVESS